jgi:site-specific recombinase XerD
MTTLLSPLNGEPANGQELIPVRVTLPLTQAGFDALPALFTDAGERASFRLIEFFTANIRNRNTRTAYAQAVHRFSAWSEAHALRLEQLTPVHIAAYVEQLGRDLAKPSVKQHLAALRMLFDYLVTGQIIPSNPAASVRGPKYVVKQGKTPVLSEDEAKALFRSLDRAIAAAGERLIKSPSSQGFRGRWLATLRDRALIGVMVYSFARIGAVLGMDVEDYCQQGKRYRIRLHEKGGKEHSVPAHHKAEEYLDAYLSAAGIASAKGTPLFRSIDAKRQLTDRRLLPRDALAMVKRRARDAGLGDGICCHSFRATGITNYLSHGGTVERAMQIASHESPRTTKLYDRTCDELNLDEIEKIQI